MSETETHIGKLKRINLNNQSVEDYCKKYCEHNNIINTYDSFTEYFHCELYEEYIITDNNIFQFITNKESRDYEYISFIDKNDDDTYNYVMQFHNGGTCLSEMLHDALKKI